jgi:hypothetical protein
MVRGVACLLAGSFALACATTDDPEDPLSPSLPPPPPLVRDASPIQSDSLVYTLRPFSGGYEAQGWFTYTNTTGHTVHFRRCLLSSTEPLVSIARTEVDTLLPTVVNVIWACAGLVPSGELDPGATVSVSLFLGSAQSPQANPPVQRYERVGRFRVSFQLCSAPGVDGCPLLPLPERQSNAFEVRFPN